MARIVIGLRWECTPGKKHCEECSKLDGQEYYYNPKVGQRSVEEMPKPPLHPNCSCRRKPIYKYGELSRYFAAGGREILPGIAVGSDDLEIDALAQYGNYGGPIWTIGRNEAKLRGDEEKIKPVDAMDECFMNHQKSFFELVAVAQ
ncbi:MAG: hypothetical protein AB1814_14855 [Thermodesulfobacteriota bacterium]